MGRLSNGVSYPKPVPDFPFRPRSDAGLLSVITRSEEMNAVFSSRPVHYSSKYTVCQPQLRTRCSTAEGRPHLNAPSSAPGQYLKESHPLSDSYPIAHHESSASHTLVVANPLFSRPSTSTGVVRQRTSSLDRRQASADCAPLLGPNGANA